MEKKIKSQRTLKAERLENELRWIREVEVFVTGDLMDKFGITRSTAWRDIQTLQEEHPELVAFGDKKQDRHYEWNSGTPKVPGTVYEMKTREGALYFFLEIDRTPWAIYGFRAYSKETLPLSVRDSGRFPTFSGSNGSEFFIDAARLRTQSAKSVEEARTIAKVRDIFSVLNAMVGRYSFT